MDAGCKPPNATATHLGCVSFPPPCAADCTGEATCAHHAESTDCCTQQGECSGDWTGGQIVDTLTIPADLPTGQYV